MQKNIIKKIASLIVAIFILGVPQLSSAMEKAANQEIIFFSSPTCPHCLKERQFLKTLQSEFPEIKVREYTFSENIELVNDLYEKYNVGKNKQGLVPISFIANQYFVGFNEDVQAEIETYFLAENQEHQKNNHLSDSQDNKKIKLWGKKEIDIEKYSFPVLAIILGTIDGFNICSLGALVVILGLVMVLNSRRKILFLGGVFLLTTGLTYGLLIFLWHQLFLVIAPYIKSMELFIALISLIGGAYLLREFIKNRKQGPQCSSSNLLGKISPKIEKAFTNKKNLLTLLSIVFLFSLVITIVEFPCSAILPVLFSGILAETNLPLVQSIGYMIIYILFYLLDEIIIFLIAFFTMKIKIVSPKSINVFTLIAALIFLSLGVYYIARIFL